MIDHEQRGIKDYLLHADPSMVNPRPIIEVRPTVIGKHIGTWQIVTLKEHLENIKARKKQRLPCGSGI